MPDHRAPPVLEHNAADLERRFGGLKRLYGPSEYERIRASRVCVVGVGGVGSWAAEALARCGVAELVLIDLDHVAESNINRQVQALESSLGQAKVVALQDRIAQIHPACRVRAIEEFVGSDNWPALLPVPVDVVIDACDDQRAKWALARWALQARQPLVIVGAAGGKSAAHRVEVGDLLHTTHDTLLAQLRQRLRKEQLLPAAGSKPAPKACGLSCVFSREESIRPSAVLDEASCEVDAKMDTGLSCHGFGSVVTVTAAFGLIAADEALRILRASGACARRA